MGLDIKDHSAYIVTNLNIERDGLPVVILLQLNTIDSIQYIILWKKIKLVLRLFLNVKGA